MCNKNKLLKLLKKNCTKWSKNVLWLFINQSSNKFTFKKIVFIINAFLNNILKSNHFFKFLSYCIFGLVKKTYLIKIIKLINTCNRKSKLTIKGKYWKNYSTEKKLYDYIKYNLNYKLVLPN